LVSLDWMPQRVTASAIPIGAALFLIAEALRIPKVLRDARGSGFIDTEAIEAMSHGAPDLSGGAEKKQ
ncbi:MAG TPA: TRAP transporter small permease, partial [Pseudolabrys sp.]|nr:TRAP transporter small permease [Pseudolabrys sp.]